MCQNFDPWGFESMATQQDPSSEVLESLVELYLRLNGYFCITNYLDHNVIESGLAAEIDLLAMRMPHQKEPLQDGRSQQNDKTLILPESDDLIDCVMAEVKRSYVKFNDSIRGCGGVERIAGFLRMFGVFPEEAFIPGGAAHGLAHDLHQKVNCNQWADFPKSGAGVHEKYRTCVRMLVFASERPKHTGKRKHVDLDYVLAWVKSRMKLGKACPEYNRIAWRGWARLIVETIDETGGQGDLAIDELVKKVICRQQTSKGICA
jgi:hypothetical protein